MIKYAKIIDDNLKICSVGLGDDIEFYKSIGMEPMDVEQAWDGNWYLVGYKPLNPGKELEAQLIELELKYNMPRVIREGILANPSMYSEFNVNRARDLEAIAEKIRQLKEGK